MTWLGPIRKPREVANISAVGRVLRGRAGVRVRAFGLVNPMARLGGRRLGVTWRPLVPRKEPRTGWRGCYAAHALSGALLAAFLCSQFSAISTAADAAECKKYPLFQLQLVPELHEVDRLIRDCAYDEAVKQAEQIENPGYRVWSIGQVAKAMSAAGQLDNAESIVRRFDHGYQRDHILLQIVRGNVEIVEDTSTAFRLLDMIEAPGDRATALCYVAAGQLARDRASDARKTAALARNEALKLVDTYAVAQLSGTISAVFDELGQPEMLQELLKDLTLDGLIIGPSHLIATMASATMRSEIQDIRDAVQRNTLERIP